MIMVQVLGLGDPDGVSGCLLQSGTDSADVVIWAVNQRMDLFLSLFLCISITLPVNKQIKNCVVSAFKILEKYTCFVGTECPTGH